MKKLAAILLSVVIIISCSKEINRNNESAGIQGNANGKPITRAFKGNFYTSVDPDPSNAPILCAGDIPNFGIPGKLLIHGNALHLGELIWQESTLQHNSCNLSIPLLSINVSGHITASNGDQIFYTGSDVINVLNLLLGNTNPGSITGTWTITGGTGRFEEASGSITINGTVDFATLSASFDATGTITY